MPKRNQRQPTEPLIRKHGWDAIASHITHGHLFYVALHFEYSSDQLVHGACRVVIVQVNYMAPFFFLCHCKGWIDYIVATLLTKFRSKVI